MWAVDIAVVVLGTGLLAWVVVAGPWTAHHITDLQTAVRIGYVTRDVLLLAALVWLLAAVRWNASVWDCSPPHWCHSPPTTACYGWSSFMR
jgi:hypothetical protein